jgi:antitoxin component YwqK of YwqJK toxin-antitoxin module
MSSTLDELIKKCAEFTDNHNDKHMYVYKLCKSLSKEWLILMKKLKDTRTNEERKNVMNENYTKFRADKLAVIFIINVNNPFETTKTMIHKFDDTECLYEVDTIVEADYYDDDVRIVCSHGIHYFKTIEPAYYYRDIPIGYIGKWRKWYDNGAKKSEQILTTESGSGHMTMFYANGIKMTEGNMLDNKLTGKWITYYEDGRKGSEAYFIEGKRSGLWTQYYIIEDLFFANECSDLELYEHDRKYEEGIYVDDKKTGFWTYWHENGERHSYGEYINGKKSGPWTEWYDEKDGKIKKEEGDFCNGNKSGPWTEWRKDGTKYLEGEYIEAEKHGKWTKWRSDGTICLITDYHYGNVNSKKKCKRNQ